MSAFMSRSSAPCEGARASGDDGDAFDIHSGHPDLRRSSADIDHVVAIGYVMAMRLPRTVAFVFPVIAAVAILAGGEAPAGIAPGAAALPPDALIVALNGNDANPGTLALPFATIQKAVNVVPVGGTIAIRGGTYALLTNIQIKRSGTAAGPITMTSYPGERV